MQGLERCDYAFVTSAALPFSRYAQKKYAAARCMRTDCGCSSVLQLERCYYLSGIEGPNTDLEDEAIVRSEERLIQAHGSVNPPVRIARQYLPLFMSLCNLNISNVSVAKS